MAPSVVGRIDYRYWKPLAASSTCPRLGLFLLSGTAGAFHRLMQFVATSNPP
jgi:hypothetical protein